MAKMIFKDRHIGGLKRVVCPECKNEFQIDNRTRAKMPYCSNCGMIVLDAAQKFCCWCGDRFAEVDEPDPLYEQRPKEDV